MKLLFCIFKQLTGLPCPGCGSTRAFVHLLHGDIKQAMWYNPLAIILLVVFMAVLVASIVERVLHHRTPRHPNSVFNRLFGRRLPSWVIAVAALLTVANWTWNLAKGI